MGNEVQMGSCECRSLTVLESLYDKRDRAKKALEAVEAAIKALEAAPEVSNVLELLAKVGIRY